MHLLLVEGDAPLAARLGDRLRAAGMTVDLATDSAMAQQWPALDRGPALDRVSAIILDLDLAGSMDLLIAWRHTALNCPVIVLTSRGLWQDKVKALDAGADDFVIKPVRFEELLARIHALLRRHQGADGDWIERKGLRLDLRGLKAELNGQPLRLTRLEFRLLHLFLRHAGHMLSQADIVDHLYQQSDRREMNAIEVLISRLRRKIGASRIETVRGMGYRFVA